MAQLRSIPLSVPVMISLGGALGALARYGLQQSFPPGPGEFVWITFAVNTVGCFLIGVLLTLVSQLWPGARLLHPFLGVGVLGGFTTFSNYVVDIQHILATGAARTALAYLAATILTALLAVWIGVMLTSRIVRRLRTTPQKADPDR